MSDPIFAWAAFSALVAACLLALGCATYIAFDAWRLRHLGTDLLFFGAVIAVFQLCIGLIGVAYAAHIWGLLS